LQFRHGWKAVARGEALFPRRVPAKAFGMYHVLQMYNCSGHSPSIESHIAFIVLFGANFKVEFRNKFPDLGLLLTAVKNGDRFQQLKLDGCIKSTNDLEALKSIYSSRGDCVVQFEVIAKIKNYAFKTTAEVLAVIQGEREMAEFLGKESVQEEG
jgi:hypothetical protein